MDEPSVKAPVSVIGSQFMLPYDFDVKIDKNSNGDFAVTDMDHKILVKVKPCDTFYHHKRILLDPDDNPIVTMRKQMMTAHDRWDVFKGDSKSDSDKLFTTQTPNIIQLKTSVHMFLENKAGSKDACDFKMEGSWTKRNLIIYKGDASTTMIAQMNKMKKSEKNRFVKDKFVVTINGNVDYAFVVTLIAIVEAMKTPIKSKGGGGKGEAAGGALDMIGAMSSG